MGFLRPCELQQMASIAVNSDDNPDEILNGASQDCQDCQVPHQNKFYRGSSENTTTPYPSSCKMAGIPRPNTQHADSEDEELIFHFELGENPPLTSTVATFKEKYFNRHKELDSLPPVKGYVLGGPRGSSHEFEPRSPSSLHLKPKVMAAQAIEALNRTFIDLKSKNEETRLQAPSDLRGLVITAARSEVPSHPAFSTQADYS